jgi:hypothetical protein
VIAKIGGVDFIFFDNIMGGLRRHRRGTGQ